MTDRVRKTLENHLISASAPCRIDMGGTLDISTFYLPLQHIEPCTFNAALDLRTRVHLRPAARGRVRVTSRGFDPTEHGLDTVPFDSPLGLIFAVAAYFGVDGLHIEIDSASPPKSALGGSSVAAVALVAALSALTEPDAPLSRDTAALLAHAIEAGVAGVPCGLQDQLAAAYGGVNAWHWKPGRGLGFVREPLAPSVLASQFLVAYCGISHESKDINGTWVRQFLSGVQRRVWHRIIEETKHFVAALRRGDLAAACAAMNRETALRREMTPEVLNATGEKLVGAAVAQGCGARFTGAGGGGCLWTLGPKPSVDKLRPCWEKILSTVPGARLLDAGVDTRGLVVEGGSSES
jgi:D-glycero-alpha-D-manno-heptose-7-phosphate kinase